MATKLRSFSTHTQTKAAAVLLALAFLVLAVYAAYDLVYDARRYELEPEALLTREYEDSDRYYDWLERQLRRLNSIAASDGPGLAAEELTEAGLLYRVQVGEAVYTNAPGHSARDLMPDEGRWIAYAEGERTLHLKSDGRVYDYAYASSAQTNLYSAFVSAQLFIPDAAIADRLQHWELSYSLLRRHMAYLGAYALSFLLLNLYLCAAAGRVPGDRELHRRKIDRLWTELLLLAFFGVAAAALAMTAAFVQEAFYRGRGVWSSRGAVVWVCSLLLGAAYCMALPFLLSMMRKIKARCFFRQTAVAAVIRCVLRFFRHVFLFFRALFDGTAYQKYPFTRAMFRRRLCYILCSAACVLLFVFGLAVSPTFCLLALALEAVITWWYLRADNEVLQGVTGVVDQISHIADGDLGWTPALSPASPLAPASRRLSDIGGGMQKSVEKQMQSERMKVELVTNVSHDLKTPLTSIISYVELLSKTGDLPPEARDYVAILAQKSDRLKSLVYDLFELAKTTSGNTEIQSEALDFHRLVEQTLGEMQERIDRSGLALRVTLAQPPVTIWADGRKMYRALQNVIDNALKYSMPGTRVFVDLSILGARAVLTVKNTAGYEMDFTAEEITERFVRGDKARTAEGSGLGLSIAQSFTQACGGRFAVDIDGDQFKVHISFDLYTAAPASDPA